MLLDPTIEEDWKNATLKTEKYLIRRAKNEKDQIDSSYVCFASNYICLIGFAEPFSFTRKGRQRQ
jgi:hypothetical protein